jgi:hypothetical protein
MDRASAAFTFERITAGFAIDRNLLLCDLRAASGFVTLPATFSLSKKRRDVAGN